MRLLIPFLFLLLACAQVRKTQAPPLSSAIPILTADTDTGSMRLQLSDLHISVQVTGNMATTSFDMKFYNPSDKILEGSFDFPLANGQTVSRYALEIEGQLREGVVVEKTKARVAFEDIVRKGIDPGLVEKTRGNNFRTRIYPIPAKGYKRVVIAIEEALQLNGEAYTYRLPLYAKQLVRSFSLAADVMPAGAKPELADNELAGFAFLEKAGSYGGGWKKDSLLLDHLFAFAIPFNKTAPVVLTENLEGKTYFYLHKRFSAGESDRKVPSSVGLLWDISASMSGRDREKEKELIRRYLAGFGRLKLSLIPFHIRALPAEEFIINNGNADALIKRMDELNIDGGTQLGALHLAQYTVDQFLLFSDGLSSFGKKELVTDNRPVMTICSSPSADFSTLKYIARQSGGKFIDLSKAAAKEAAEALGEGLIRVGKPLAEGISDLTCKLDEINHTISLAGLLEGEEGKIRLMLNGEELQFSVRKENAAAGIGRIWAAMRIEEMDGEYSRHKEEITALGKQFSIVTRNTSLLVLDRVEDYAEHGILPPPELREEYHALIKGRDEEKEDKKAAAFTDALEAMEELKAWWHGSTSLSTDPALPPATQELVRFSPPRVVENQEAAGDSAVVLYDALSTDRSGMPPPAVSEWSYTTETSIQSNGSAGADGDGVQDQFIMEQEESSTIKVSPWKADAPYLDRLRIADRPLRYSTYLDLKKEYGGQPSFFVDVARYFHNENEAATALLVLSNVAEMKLEDPELLRILGLQLQELKEPLLAVETFREVLEIREEEPQAYRDLALALNDAGQYSEAVGLLYRLITGAWDERFGEVRSIAISEMNAIISAHPGETDLSAIDNRFIYAMPVDVRIVIGWTVDNADVDLWVTDPRKEKCLYSNNRTSIGGRLSQDVTQGYGPEEFLLKKAVKGDYVVEANLYGDHRQTLGGPITITAELFTDFGRPSQKRSIINFRVTDSKEVVYIGKLKKA
ncbi:MAG TPA: VIT domain-containing protein [Flavisolibacter sp.]|nr:VIT domain-containing protein [Flavisolibacter sp.]